MKLPLSWLSDYLDMTGIDAGSYAHGMTMSGSKVEGVENLGEAITNVVTGKILKIDRHPDADKLVVCQLDVGNDEPIQIVTGAPNVFEGAMVPVAKHKSTLAHGIKITKGKLRGVMSMGMMCSTDELGLSDARADGILILPDDTPIGADICDVLGLNESIVEFEITSNRPDCLSIIGIARESAATFNRTFNIPAVTIKGAGGNASDYASVEVIDKDLCPRYTARVIKNVKIAPSPEWLQKRLKACGVRSINNIVDITNYIMLEYGQPMHAFDLSNVAGDKIIVRRALDGEKLTSLDDIERTLTPDMLVIADGERSVAVAGVMGGQNSEVQDTTTSILFESANFDAVSVRRTAKKLGLRTEASIRFEKGLDAENTLSAVNRACQLIEELGAGEVIDGVIDVRGEKKEPKRLPLEVDKINKFIGIDITCEEMVKILKSLEFPTENTSDGVIVTVPGFRGDIECTADISEEIARIYSYDKIPTSTMHGSVVCGAYTDMQRFTQNIKANLAAQGLCSIMTYSFTNPKNSDLMLLPQNDNRRNAVRIANPLGTDTSVMRTSMIPSMMEILVHNYNQRNEEALLFEIGNIYIPRNEGELPDEKPTLCIGMYGGQIDYYTIKGVVDELLDQIGITGAVEFIPNTSNTTFHPGRCAHICVSNHLDGTKLIDSEIGVIGQIHPQVGRNFKMDAAAYICELDIWALSAAHTADKQYKPLPKFPAITRDIAMIVNDNINIADIEKIFQNNKSDIMECFKLFDVYKGKQIDDNKKSVAYSITFRSAERTLTDGEVNEIMQNIISELENKLSIQLRM